MMVRLVFAAIVEAIIAFELFEHFLTPKTAKRVYTLAIYVGFVVSLTLTGYLNYFWFTTVTCIALHLVLGRFLFKGKLLQQLVLSIIIVTIGIMAEFVSAFFISFLFDIEVITAISNPYFMLSIYVLSKSISFLFAKWLIALFPRSEGKYFDKTSFLLTIFPLLSIANEYYILYLSYKSNLNQFELTVGALIGIGLMCMGMLTLLLYDIFCKKNETEQNLLVIKLEVRANNNLYKLQERNIMETKAVIHDFKNQLLNLRALYASSDIKAETYCSSLIASLDNQAHNQVVDLNNSTLSNILHRSQIRCIQLNIKLVLKLNFFELGFINPIDTSIIFDNGFDNAILACSKVPCVESRIINVDLYLSDPFVIFLITNPHANKLELNNNGLITTKEDKYMHGIGLENMKKVTQKYGGDLIFDFSDSEFSLTIRLQAQSKF